MKSIIAQKHNVFTLFLYLLAILLMATGCEETATLGGKPSRTTAFGTPIITTQPASQTIEEGKTATLSVVATHPTGATLSYQWYKVAAGSSTFTAIAGATSDSYTTDTRRLANSDTQYCVVVTATNAAGLSRSTTSNIAIISMLLPTNIVWTDRNGTRHYTDAPQNGILLSSLLTSSKNNIRSVDTIPFSVTRIGDSAFCDSRSLTSITLPSSVTRIGESAFAGCTSLTSITLPNSVASIGKFAFVNCSGLTSITLPNSVTSIGEAAFRGCSGLTSITLPSSVTSIVDWAFVSCTSLTSITLPNSVTSIGENAFLGCTSLTSITLPNSVTSIGWGAFSSCTSLTSITLPNSVTSIGENAFSNCKSLTSITIPSSVTSIGAWAFRSCSSLTSVRVEATTPPTAGAYMFTSTASTLSISVPHASVDAYKAAEGWSEYAGEITGY